MIRKKPPPAISPWNPATPKMEYSSHKKWWGRPQKRLPEEHNCRFNHNVGCWFFFAFCPAINIFSSVTVDEWRPGFFFLNIIATNWYMNTFEKDGITSQLGSELLSSLGLDKSLISKAASCTRTLSFFSVMVRKQSNPDISRTLSCFHLNHLSWHGRGAPRQ